MASSRANLSKKAKLIGIGAAIGLVIGAFSVFMLFTYNPPDKQEEPNVDVAVLMSEISQINELATASQTYTVVEKVESNSKLFDTIDIPFSENFFILTYMGELKAGVNLDEAQVALEGTTVKVSLPQATILSDAIDTTSFKVLHEQNNFLNPIGVEDVTQYIDAPRSGGCRHQRRGAQRGPGERRLVHRGPARRRPARRLHDRSQLGGAEPDDGIADLASCQLMRTATENC